jgi:hypothetical protein
MYTQLRRSGNFVEKRIRYHNRAPSGAEPVVMIALKPCGLNHRCPFAFEATKIPARWALSEKNGGLQIQILRRGIFLEIRCRPAGAPGEYAFVGYKAFGPLGLVA